MSDSSLQLTTTPLLEVNLSHPIYMIWGSNTDVGKTLVSTGLATSILSSQIKFNYIKPVQTGFPLDSDSRFVYSKVSEFFVNRKPEFSLLASNHGLKASVPAWKQVSGTFVDSENEGDRGLKDLCWYEETRIEAAGIDKDDSSLGAELACKSICSWKEAISPHLAVQREGGDVKDSWLLEALQKNLVDGGGGDGRSFWTIVETAGGVASPGPSGSLQCDLYRSFRLPAILVGDGRLGGISGTISAYESLKLRGYDVAAIIIIDHGLLNEESLISYLRNKVPVLVLPSVPRDQPNNLMEWFDESQNVFKSLSEVMQSSYSERLRRLQDMPKKAQDIFWWPFTQHGLVPEENVTVIDSRCGENFAVHKAKNHDVITQQFDACASWWTQGPDATLQVELARDMGYAAARFGHVMFPENVYEPALRCA
ncbi:hypothetical protein MKW98_011106 [Papaver atlanticum]|uniref:Uncharacterized protein n=1 Tax=Papaver atlanticum TaxID=357466 RepID=A0AAD4XX24_9MAGN|nr:hypothetical protein MKW98_011106 [Papaver atlanticum]